MRRKPCKRLLIRAQPIKPKKTRSTKHHKAYSRLLTPSPPLLMVARTRISNRARPKQHRGRVNRDRASNKTSRDRDSKDKISRGKDRDRDKRGRDSKDREMAA